jgi:adenosine/AMP kinase
MIGAAPSGVVTFLFTDVEGSTVGGKPTRMACGQRWPPMKRYCVRRSRRTGRWQDGCVTTTSLSWDVVSVDKPDEVNVVIGQAHFIKTVEDLHEALVGVSASLRFGLAFCEASGPRLVRRTGNDAELVELATRNALAIAAGHCFVIFLREGFPVNVLNPVKAVPEVCTIHCATANPVDVVVAVTPIGRGIVAVVDGQTPLGVETDRDVAERHDLLRAIGYKLGPTPKP